MYHVVLHIHLQIYCGVFPISLWFSALVLSRYSSERQLRSSRLRLRSTSSSCGPSLKCSAVPSLVRIFVYCLHSWIAIVYHHFLSVCDLLYDLISFDLLDPIGCWEMNPLSTSGFSNHWTCVKPASARICFSLSSASFKVKSVSIAGFTSSIWVNLVFGLTSRQSDFIIFDDGFWTYSG